MKLDKELNLLNQDEKIDFYSKLLSQIPDLIFQMTISSNGKFILAAGKEGLIRIYDYFLRGQVTAA
jgi:hypothetical protein